MLLFCEVVVRVAVSVDRAVQLLERHECSHKLVVRVKQASEPLLGFDVMNLESSVLRHAGEQFGTHVSKHLSS